MNSMRKILVSIAAVLTFAAFAGTAGAYDLSESIWLDRYTVLANDSLKYESGHLLKNGKFQSLWSEIVDPIYYDSLDDFFPISGKPIMNEQLYTSYKTLGYIPKWTRSQDDFDLYYVTYVIVAVTGKGDPNPAITILAQPENELVLAGGWAFFDVDAEPWWYLSYQWNFKGKPIPGKTRSWLEITNVTPADAGIYTVSLSTGGQPVLSKKALLKIAKPVVVKTQPRSQTVKPGKNVIFRVGVTGTGPFTYQWYWNNVAITNATKSYLKIPKVQPEDAGTYFVYIDNGPSAAWSYDANLTVGP